LSLFLQPQFWFIHLILPLGRDLAHTRTDIIVAADGARIVSQCLCGGTHEAHVGPETFADVSTDDDFPDALGRALGDLPRQLTSAWRESHRQCAAARRG
jgi:hypothetical protein